MNKNNQLAYNDSFLGFTDGRTALQTGKIEKCLSKAFRYDGVVMEIRKNTRYGRRKCKWQK